MTLDRILVFRAGHLGDNLIALPALWALRDAFPQAHLTYLSNADDRNPHYVTARSVFPETGLFDSWISYPTLGGALDPVRLLTLATKLRRERFDAVIYMTTRTRTEYQIDRDVRFFRLAGIKKIFGTEFMKANNLVYPLEGPMREVQSEGAFLVDLLRESELADREKAFFPDLRLTTAEHEAATRLLTSDSARRADQRFIGVAPGSKWDSKIWDEERFEKVVARLITTHDVFPIIFGGGEDREKGDRLLDKWGIGINAAGVLSVREAAAALEEMQLYLGNDTGTMHLAACVGTPCVAIFSALDLIGRWHPFGDQNEIFRRSVECEGCFSPVCFNNHKCLDLISVDEVYEACVRVLERRSAMHEV